MKENLNDEQKVPRGNPVTFFIGVIILIAGVFMVLHNTQVGTFRGIGYGYASAFGWGWQPPFGLLILPLIVGIIILIATDKNMLGWIFVLGGLAIILLGILMSIDFRFKTTTAYVLIIMFGAIAAGIGMIIKGLYGKSK